MRKLIGFLVLIPCGLLLAADETAETETRKANEAIKFSVSAGAVYTDNRDALPTKVSNVDFTITPRLALDLKWDEVSLILLYAPTYRYRSNANIIENDSQLLHDFSMNLGLQPTRRTKIRLREDFNLTDDPSVQQGGTTLRRDSSYVLSQTEVGMNHLFSHLSNIDIFGRYMMKRFDNAEVKKESDVSRMDAGITFWKQPAKNFALIGLANLSKYEYEKYLNIDRGFDSAVIGVGLEQEFSSYVKYGLRGGVQSLQYADNSVESASSPYASLSLQVNTVPSTRILASLSHSVSDSAIFPFASQKSTDAGISLNWESPSSVLQVVFSLDYRISDYDSDTVTADFASKAGNDQTLANYLSSAGIKPGDEKATIASIALTYKIGLATTIKLVQSYEDVNSGVKWSYDRNATALSVTRIF